MENYNVYEEKKEGSTLGGVCGALIGAVIGAILWGVIGILTQHSYWIVAALIGVIVAFGYELLKGRKGVIKYVVIVLCVILAVVGGDLIYGGWIINEEYQEINALLANGTDNEIAQFFFQDEMYEEYQRLHPIDKRYNIQLIRDEYAGQSLQDFYNRYYKNNPDWNNSVMRDTLSSIVAGLFGGLPIASKKKKKDESIRPVNFEEATEASSEAVKQPDQPSI